MGTRVAYFLARGPE